jgi:hypothetical protein
MPNPIDPWTQNQKARERERKIWNFLVLSFGIVVVAIGLYVVSNRPKSQSVPRVEEPVNAESRRFPAQNLAIIDGLELNDTDVAETFAKLDDMCLEDGERLADIVVNSMNYVIKRGGKTTNLDMMKGLLNAYSDNPKVIKSCAEGAALLVTIMLAGK